MCAREGCLGGGAQLKVLYIECAQRAAGDVGSRATRIHQATVVVDFC